jgi:hypothetical protein
MQAAPECIFYCTVFGCVPQALGVSPRSHELKTEHVQAKNTYTGEVPCR